MKTQLSLSGQIHWTELPKIKCSVVKKVKVNKEANGYRLPNAKEWATACKGEGKFKYPGSDDIKEVAWYKDTANVERNGNKYCFIAKSNLSKCLGI